jgi:hypothetical protein|tara:strand:- start:41802 stop:42020 length:219 start_codon:yes stop_codon:yes gene_type:complete
LTKTLPEILKEVDVLDNESKQFKADLLRLCWYMRGGLTMTEAFETCQEDRILMSAIVKENLETTKKSGLPFF